MDVLELTGADEVIEALGVVSGRVLTRWAGELAEDAIESVANRARNLAPVWTGTLRDFGIEVDVVEDVARDEVRALLGLNRDAINPQNGESAAVYGVIQEYANGGRNAFFRPAFAQEMPGAMQQFENELRARIAREFQP